MTRLSHSNTRYCSSTVSMLMPAVSHHPQLPQTISICLTSCSRLNTIPVALYEPRPDDLTHPAASLIGVAAASSPVLPRYRYSSTVLGSRSSTVIYKRCCSHLKWKTCTTAACRSSNRESVRQRSGHFHSSK